MNEAHMGLLRLIAEELESGEEDMVQSGLQAIAGYPAAFDPGRMEPRWYFDPVLQRIALRLVCMSLEAGGNTCRQTLVQDAQAILAGLWPVADSELNRLQVACI